MTMRILAAAALALALDATSPRAAQADWLLTPYLGKDAIWWSFPVGTITSAALTTLYYLFGGWRKSRMLHSSAYGQAADAGQSAPAMDPAEEDEEAAAVVAAAEAAKRPARVSS